MRRALRALGAASTWASFLLSGTVARASDTQPPQTRAELGTKAKPEPKAEPQAEPASPAPAPPSAAEGTAEAAYQRALATYATGDIKGAFDSMRESYRLSQRPELLYNLARLERELEECQASLEDYRRYLQRVPNGRYRDAAEQACHELERECPVSDAAPDAAPVPPKAVADATIPPQPPPPPRANAAPSYWTAPRVLAWSAVGAGIAAGGAALSFELAAKSARNELAEKIALGNPQDYSLDLQLRDRQHRDETAAIVLGVTAGALVTSGVLFLIFGPDSAQKSEHKAFVYFPQGGLGACYSHGF